MVSSPQIEKRKEKQFSTYKWSVAVQVMTIAVVSVGGRWAVAKTLAESPEHFRSLNFLNPQRHPLATLSKVFFQVPIAGLSIELL